jgi:hypothetical protein
VSALNPPTYPQTNWWKSSYSGGANDCVEIADTGEHILIRDSKSPLLPIITIGRCPLRNFVHAIRNDVL